jgi:hypothetical protein
LGLVGGESSLVVVLYAAKLTAGGRQKRGLDDVYDEVDEAEEEKLIGVAGSEVPAFSRSANRQAWEQYAPSAICLSHERQKSWDQSISVAMEREWSSWAGVVKYKKSKRFEEESRERRLYQVWRIAAATQVGERSQVKWCEGWWAE